MGMKITKPIQTLVMDEKRHLVCLPYSPKNLHLMAAQVGIGRHWFHRDHYDVPVGRIAIMKELALLVSPKVIVRLILAYRNPARRNNLMIEGSGEGNLDHEARLYLKFKEQKLKHVHYCPDWDYMAIHEGSVEFDACQCELDRV